MNIVNKDEKDWFLFFIFLAALAIRIIHTFQTLQSPLTEFFITSNTFDQYEYNKAAINILSKNWLYGGVFGKEPFYSYVLALLYKIFTYNHAAVYIFQAICTSLGALFLYKIACQIFNRVTGIIAGFIFSFYSLSIYYDAILLRESLITSLNIFLCYFILRALRIGKVIIWLFSGLMLGLLILMRHNMLFPFILIFILCSIRPLKKAFKYALVFFIGVFGIMLPVILRNYIVSDYSYIGISKEVNAFWVGNNYTSSGIDAEWSPAYYELEKKTGGAIKNIPAVFFEEIRKRPKAYAQLYLRKLWMFFNGYEAPSNTNYYLYREEFPTILRLPLFNFQCVSALALIGIVLSIFRKNKPYLVYIFLGVLSMSVILFHIQARFRLPTAPFFIIFSAHVVYYTMNKIRYRGYALSIFLMILFAFLYVILRPDLTYAGFRQRQDAIRPLDRTNLALAYIEAYKKSNDSTFLKKAFTQCNSAIQKEKKPSVPYSIKAHIYMLEKNYNESIQQYIKALLYEPRNPFLYNELAGVYYFKKDFKKSWICIKRALKLFPKNKVFEHNLNLVSHEYQ